MLTQQCVSWRDPLNCGGGGFEQKRRCRRESMAHGDMGTCNMGRDPTHGQCTVSCDIFAHNGPHKAHTAHSAVVFDIFVQSTCVIGRRAGDPAHGIGANPPDRVYEQGGFISSSCRPCPSSPWAYLERARPAASAASSEKQTPSRSHRPGGRRGSTGMHGRRGSGHES